MVYIYALELKQGKYYIGKTSNPNFRIESHFNSEGSGWTKKHNPIKILEIILDKQNFLKSKNGISINLRCSFLNLLIVLNYTNIVIGFIYPPISGRPFV